MTADAETAGSAAADQPAATPTPEPTAPEARHAAAERLVRNYTLGGMAVGLVPVPLLDLAGLVAVQMKMLHGLARLYDIEFRADLGRAAVASLVGGALPTAAAPTLAFSLSKVIPLSGQLIGAGAQTLLAGAATYAVGKVFLQHFASGGTFLTFDPEAVRDYFQQQFEAGKQVASELKREPRRWSRRTDGDRADGAGGDAAADADPPDADPPNADPKAPA